MGRYACRAVASAIATAALLPVVPASAAAPSNAVVRGTVTAVARSGNTIYLGGHFSSIGPSTGGLALTNGAGTRVDTFPAVEGRIYAVTRDPRGGWFVAGDFTSIGGRAKHNLARLRRDGQVDDLWAANTNAPVLALAVSGTRLYLGGAFSTVSGTKHLGVAALRSRTGRVAKAFTASADGYVYTMLPTRGHLYLGGSFSHLDGEPRFYLGAVNSLTGRLTTFSPSPNGPVSALLPLGASILAGGSFSRVDGVIRSRLALISLKGKLARWGVPLNGDVKALLRLSDGRIGVGGQFTRIGRRQRPGIALLSAATGIATPFRIRLNGSVYAIAASKSSLYIGGSYTRIAGQARANAARVTLGGTLLPWTPEANGPVTAIAPRADGEAMLGGSFSSVGDEPRANLAAIDATTGAALSWAPATNGPVTSLTVSGPSVFFGGRFSEVNGAPHLNVAAADSTTGVPTSFSGSASSAVDALAVSGGYLWLGGSFDSVSGRPRERLAAVDPTTGAAAPFVFDVTDPRRSTEVDALVPDGSMLYVGGRFLRVAGVRRLDLAAINTATAKLTDWDPNLDSDSDVVDPTASVSSLAMGDTVVYAGGSFTYQGTRTRRYLAAYAKDRGAPTTFAPTVDGPVRALAFSGTQLYVGGGFARLAGKAAPGLGCVSPSGIACAAVNPGAFSDGVAALETNAATLVVGGLFPTGVAFLTPSLAAIAAPLPRLFLPQLAARP